MAPPLLGNRRRLLYSTGVVAGVLALGAALIATPAVAGMVRTSAQPEPSRPAEPNLALGKEATGSAFCKADESADKAFNGSLEGGLADKWCSGERRATLTVDLGQRYDLTSVTVDHAEAGGENAVMNTKAFDIRVSQDGKRFRTAARVRGNAEAQTVTELGRSARYVQLLVRVPEQRRGGAARIYEVSVNGTASPTQEPTQEPTLEPTAPAAEPTGTAEPTTPVTQPDPVSGECHEDAPEKLTDFVAEHTTPMTRIDCNADVAVYYDDNLKALPARTTQWVTPFATDVWKYLKQAYGDCAAERTLAPEIGGCENFGAPKPALFFLHKDSYSGGTVNGRFDPNSAFRTVNDIGYGNWDGTDGQLRDIIVHEACHQIELDGQGTHGSPAFGLWGDSKWAEFCLYDFYANTDRAEDAERVKTAFLKSRDDLPAGAADAAWFQDWFLPLWQDGGGKPDVMENYFGLLAQHFPTREENGGKNLTYARGLNTGEYVLFTSAAAGKDLSGRAAEAFGGGFRKAEFEQAKKDFPELKF